MDVWSRYDAGELTREETAEALGDALPAWFFEEAEARGGAALTEPGRTTQVTLHLEPGTYAMECYVKTPQGTYHNDRGMLRELTVTTDSTGAAPPEADAELTLSNYEIETSGELRAGTRTVAVYMTDTPEGLVPHDINLFRLEDTTTVEEIVAWMDWMDLEEFRAPAPGHFVGWRRASTGKRHGLHDRRPGARQVRLGLGALRRPGHGRRVHRGVTRTIGRPSCIVVPTVYCPSRFPSSLWPAWDVPTSVPAALGS